MLDHELELAVRSAAESPNDIHRWLELGRLAARVSYLRPMALAPKVLEGLRGLREKHPESVELTDALLMVAGLKAAGEPPEILGNFWAGSQLLNTEGGRHTHGPSRSPIACKRSIDGALMRFVPGGRFLRGYKFGRAEVREERDIYVSPFYLDEEPVTVERYARFLKSTGHPVPEAWDQQQASPDRPVVWISWEDAASYASWVGGRLPSEAEWEKAARGTDRRLVPWSGGARADQHGRIEVDPTKANFERTGQNRDEDDWSQWLQTVRTYPRGASPYGILDLSGNAAEWCQDWYGKGYYPKAPTSDPMGPKKGKLRVVRGGSWWSTQDEVTAYARQGLPPDEGLGTVGFRVAIPLHPTPDGENEPDSTTTAKSQPARVVEEVCAKLEPGLPDGWTKGAKGTYRRLLDEVCQVIAVFKDTAQYRPVLRLAFGVRLIGLQSTDGLLPGGSTPRGTSMDDCHLRWSIAEARGASGWGIDAMLIDGGTTAQAFGEALRREALPLASRLTSPRVCIDHWLASPDAALAGPASRDGFYASAALWELGDVSGAAEAFSQTTEAHERLRRYCPPNLRDRIRDLLDQH